jgi:hypothetical protein
MHICGGGVHDALDANAQARPASQLTVAVRIAENVPSVLSLGPDG